MMLIENLKTREDYNELLKHNIIRVTFEKSDGSERVMYGTLRDNFLPPKPEPKEGEVPKVKKEPNPELVNLFDLEANGWRSFKLASVKEVRYLTEPELVKLLEIDNGKAETSK